MEGKKAMTVYELIEKLQALPPNLPVMLCAEAGVDLAQSVCVIDVAKHRRDWSGTPSGNYRQLPDDDVSGDVFRAVLINLEPEGL